MKLPTEDLRFYKKPCIIDILKFADRLFYNYNLIEEKVIAPS
ncbi:hypothetical protein ADICYQ_5916 [Cyclobacterium qasimii M12-11B]|uniref:Uncharacterized protein n=1 Tax=Cyclobacterium qasimii M12-11B TaxID=641524 RepID=S7V5A1_9BACT|nr:hypothetical protein ADICYQ_5916 [Cyclobacterium qasimii M12-11B]